MAMIAHIKKIGPPRKDTHATLFNTNDNTWKACHTCSSLLRFELLIHRLCAIDGFTSPPIPMCDITTLNHETGNAMMKCGTLVVEWFAT
jgi:hypothetical protein